MKEKETVMDDEILSDLVLGLTEDDAEKVLVGLAAGGSARNVCDEPIQVVGIPGSVLRMVSNKGGRLTVLSEDSISIDGLDGLLPEGALESDEDRYVMKNQDTGLYEDYPSEDAKEFIRSFNAAMQLNALANAILDADLESRTKACHLLAERLKAK
jgi:hypothetical protein